MIREAYELGKRMYRLHGYKPGVSPFNPGTDEYNSFERGMTQAYKRNPSIALSNELEDKAEKQAAAQEAREKQRSEEKKRKIKRQAYLNATRAG